MTPRHLTIANRTFLALASLVSVGCAVLLMSRRDQGSQGFGIATRVLAELRLQVWWPASVVAVATVTSGLLALWCARQVRRGAHAKLPLTTRDTVMLRRALERAVTEEALRTGGVARCRTRVTRDGRHLRLRMKIALRRDASPDEALPAIDVLLAGVNDTLAPQTVRADIHFVSAASHRSRPRLSPAP
ncbi:hypothetical protein [Streptomyces sp. NPDC058486]|uniref:hypothetical protein n=1 Tax=unclassified Streptomyces TaxID=2593676 RepID=UPI00365948BD